MVKNISKDNMLRMAEDIANYTEKNRSLPSKLTYNNVNFFILEYAYVMSYGVYHLKNGFTVPNFSWADNPNGDTVNVNVVKDEYMNIAKTVYNQILKNRKVPNNILLKNGKKADIRLYIYCLAKCIRFYKQKGHLPSNVQFDSNIFVKPKTQTNKIHYGYWVFGKDMLNVDLGACKNNGVTDIFLNYYAFEKHGDSKVSSWIKQASDKGINIHIWVQTYYDGEWHNPVNTDMRSKKNEIRRYANMTGVTGIHLDYLRYPGNAYKTSGGADTITQFVREVRNENPRTVLTCAVMPENDGKKYYGQDLDALGKIVDAVIPMQYKGNYNSGSSWLASTTKSFSSKATVWSGLQAYKSDSDTRLLSASELKGDIKTCLDNGAKGVLLFRYGLSPNINFKSL